MSIIKEIQSLFASKADNIYSKIEPDNVIHQAAKLLFEHSSTCTCGGVSPPTQLKGSTYQCLQCDKKFENISYNLGRRERKDAFNAKRKDASQLLDMNYYDEAISFLKQHLKK